MSLRGVLGQQNGCLGQETDEHDESRLHVDVVLQAPHPREKEAAEQSERHAQDDGKGDEEALVERTQYKVYEKDADDKDDGGGVAERRFLARHAAELVAIAFGKHLGGCAADGFQRLSAAVTVGGLSHDGDAAEEVKAVQALAAIDALHRDVLRDGNHLPALAADTHVGERFLVETELGRRLHDDAIKLCEARQVAAVGATDIARKHLQHSIRRHAIALATGSIYFHAILRILCVEGGKRAGDGGFLVQGVDENACDAHQVLDLAALAVLHVKLKATCCAVTRYHGTGADTYLRLRDVCSPAVDFIYHGVDVVAFRLAFIPVLKADIERAGGRRLVECRAAPNGHVVETELRDVLDATFHLARYLACHGHARARSALDVDVDGAHVLVWNEACLSCLEHVGQQEADRHNGYPGQPTVVEDAQDAPLVLDDNAMEADVERLVEARREARVAFSTGPKHQGTQGGRERHRVDGGDDNGYRHRHTKLGVEDARGAAHETNGDEDAHEDDGGRDEGRGEAFHRVNRGEIRRLVALVELRLDGLHHDDGVVHHRADYQDQSKERQQVKAKADEVKHGEGAYQTDHDGERRDERALEVLQEDIDDKHHEHDGLEKRAHDIVDAGVEEVLRMPGGNSFFISMAVLSMSFIISLAFEPGVWAIMQLAPAWPFVLFWKV